MEIHALLQANCEKLLEQYRINLRSVRTLQATLIDDILPSIRDELDLSQEATSWARVWLEDTCMLSVKLANGLLTHGELVTVFQIARVSWRVVLSVPVADLVFPPAT